MAATRTANRKRKARGGTRRRRRNTTSRRTANTSRKLNTAARTPNRRRRSTRRRRNTSLRRFNPFSVGGMQIKNLAAAGAGALITSILSNVVTRNVQNPWIRIGLQFGLAYGVFKLAPRSINDAMVAGAATVPVVNLVNQLVPNLQSQIAQWIPMGQQTAAVNGEGVGQLVDVNPALFTGGGMGQLAYVPAQSEYLT